MPLEKQNKRKTGEKKHNKERERGEEREMTD